MQYEKLTSEEVHQMVQQAKFLQSKARKLMKRASCDVLQNCQVQPCLHPHPCSCTPLSPPNPPPQTQSPTVLACPKGTLGSSLHFSALVPDTCSLAHYCFLVSILFCAAIGSVLSMLWERLAFCRNSVQIRVLSSQCYANALHAVTCSPHIPLRTALQMQQRAAPGVVTVSLYSSACLPP